MGGNKISRARRNTSIFIRFATAAFATSGQSSVWLKIALDMSQGLEFALYLSIVISHSLLPVSCRHSNHPWLSSHERYKMVITFYFSVLQWESIKLPGHEAYASSFGFCHSLVDMSIHSACATHGGMCARAQVGTYVRPWMGGWHKPKQSIVFSIQQNSFYL